MNKLIRLLVSVVVLGWAYYMACANVLIVLLLENLDAWVPAWALSSHSQCHNREVASSFCIFFFSIVKDWPCDPNIPRRYVDPQGRSK